MQLILVKGDPVINRRSREKGIVIDVRDEWGWFVVKYDNGHIRRYESSQYQKDCAVMLDLDRNKS